MICFSRKPSDQCRSSNAIEFNIHRIPGLSEHFVYFNDDFMLGSPVSIEDFYSPADGIKVGCFICSHPQEPIGFSEQVYEDYVVPNCSPGCKDHLMLGNRQCNLLCNVSACNYDLGDCVGKGDLPNSGKTFLAHQMALVSDRRKARGILHSFSDDVFSIRTTDAMKPTWLRLYIPTVCSTRSLA